MEEYTEKNRALKVVKRHLDKGGILSHDCCGLLTINLDLLTEEQTIRLNHALIKDL